MLHCIDGGRKVEECRRGCAAAPSESRLTEMEGSSQYFSCFPFRPRVENVSFLLHVHPVKCLSCVERCSCLTLIGGLHLYAPGDILQAYFKIHFMQIFKNRNRL